MGTSVPFSPDQSFLPPPDTRDRLPGGGLAHFAAAAVERVPLGSFQAAASGEAQYHPRLVPALLAHRYADGVFSSRRIERAAHRGVGVRFVAANLRPDHDATAASRRASRAASEAAFLRVPLLARGAGLPRVGAVAADGTKIGADAPKIRPVRHGRAKAPRAKLAADIAALTARAEAAADAEGAPDPQAPPAGIARREAPKAKLDAARARLGAEARAEADAARPACEARKAAFGAKRGRRGRPPKPPGDGGPPPERQGDLTDPDSAR